MIVQQLCSQANSSSHSPPLSTPERSLAPSPFRIDEGFSEESQSTNDHAQDGDSQMLETFDQTASQLPAVRAWLSAQPASLRLELARELLFSLPNPLIAEIVHEANDRLHFDPVVFLPQEIVQNIFEYLGPTSLLNASLVCKGWRERAYEPKLWRRLFGLEGWTHDSQRARIFRDNIRSQVSRVWAHPNIHPRPNNLCAGRLDIKRLRYSDHTRNHYDQRSRIWAKKGALELPQEWLNHSGKLRIRAESCEQEGSQDVMMQDVSFSESFLVDHNPNHTQASSAASNFDITERTVSALVKPVHLLDTSTELPRLNWQHLYIQRRRLEHNWTTGRFKTFRLPHPNFPEDAHSQCIYALQFSGKHVVSGSRDKSVRVWDLETQRLRYPPLQAHEGSVLCLQFDERPDHDVIVSGGSDSDIIIWQFSTGKLIKRLHKAHSESVLNLRFDDRYLVTCSKDKTIKLWNRRDLRPTDPEYPATNLSTKNAKYPDYIINVHKAMNNPAFFSNSPLPPYTLLMAFEGHGAAVNAIQIFGNQIVSASGDRVIMLWDIRTGAHIRTFKGHTKGIACVQYDGRRIVSGSSDNTVRIFDSSTAAEVAILEGHRNLVRTVQAEFGDIPGAEETLEAEARANDRQILEQERQHLFFPQTATWPKRYYVYGAKLPPGGGGNRWSKIISGSYDETVIIWRRDKDGRWDIAKELRQDDAMRSTSNGTMAHAPVPDADRFEELDEVQADQNQNVGLGHITAAENLLQQRLASGTLTPEQATHVRFQLHRLGQHRAEQLHRQGGAYPPHLTRRHTAQTAAGLAGAGIGNQSTVPQNPSSTSSQHLQPTAQRNQAPQEHQHTMQGVQSTQEQPPPSQAQPPHVPFSNQDSEHKQAHEQTASAEPRSQSQQQQPQRNPLTPHQPTHDQLAQQQQQHQQTPQSLHTSQSTASQPQQPQQQPQRQQQMPNQQQEQIPTPHYQPQPNTSQNTLQPPPNAGQNTLQAQAPQPRAPLPQALQANTQPPNAGTATNPQPQQPGLANLPANAAAATIAAAGTPAPHHGRPQQQQQEPGHSRVFKLQFDARRIVCCSQQPVIVGWDFANGDPDLEEACWFFGEGSGGS